MSTQSQEKTATRPEKKTKAPAARKREEGKYVYCVMECTEPRTFGNVGIGGREDLVYTINYNKLAAVVSDTPIMVYDPTRENAMAHEAVNQRVMQEFTIIPMSFDTVFRTEEDVVEFLRHTEDALRDVLRKMQDKIEFGLKVHWDPDVALATIEQERDDIRLLKEQITSRHLASTYFARMQLGRLVEQAMNQKAEQHIREIYEELRVHAIASRDNKPIGEKMILNAAFLVDRKDAEAFEQRVQDMANQHEGQLRFVFTGPWPPYNFVNIRLKLEHAAG